MVKRYGVYLTDLDPTKGKEIKKTRPCIVVSPDEMNDFLRTVIVVPMTTKGRDYPTRINLVFKKKKGQVILDQIRTVDKKRLVKKLGTVSRKVQSQIHKVLAEMFEP